MIGIDGDTGFAAGGRSLAGQRKHRNNDLVGLDLVRVGLYTMWKRVMGLEGTTANVCLRRGSAGDSLKVTNYPGMTKTRADAVVLELVLYGVPATLVSRDKNNGDLVINLFGG